MSEEQQLLPLRGESALTNTSAVCAKKMMQCVGVVAFMLIVASYVAYAKYNQKWMTKVVFVETTVQSVLLCTYLCCGKNKKCIQALWSCIAAGFFILMGMLKFDRVRCAVCALALVIVIACQCGINWDKSCKYRWKKWIHSLDEQVLMMVGSIYVVMYVVAYCVTRNTNLGLTILYLAVVSSLILCKEVKNCRNKSLWKARVQEAEIVWIVCRALRTWAATAEGRLVRRQDLQRADFVCENEIDEKWCTLDQQKRFVVSHGWLSKAHPDPNGVHLQEIVAELAKCDAKDADIVFVDYCSLYQTDLCHPDALALKNDERLPAGHIALRTPAQNIAFGKAMNMMHELYTHETCDIVIVPNVPNDAANNTPYFARGWCFFEFAISTDHWRVINDENCAVSELLTSTHAPLDDSEFIEAFGKKSFTCKGDAKTV
mmetsp:Transcript_88003/g.266898  ORF Transcript_88003/g.266898 Transcript_88003/m.266898 type:complete len:430 (-) Transcript_88003:103-1392(-)